MPHTAMTGFDHHSPSSLTLMLSHGEACVQGITPTIMRIRLATQQLTHHPSRSLAGPLPHHPLELEAQETQLLCRYGEMVLNINRTPLSFTLQRPDGTILSPGNAVHFNDDSIIESRQALEDDDFFGLGERLTPLGRRGYAVDNWNTDNPAHHHELDRAMYASFPFFVSLNRQSGACFGYFLDSPCRSHFNMGELDWNTITITLPDSCADIYLFAAPTIAQLLQDYTSLTGRHQLPPLWALGYHQCRWSYTSTAAVRQLAQNFRTRHIPCDSLWYDIHHMDSYRVFTFDPTHFGDIAQCNAELEAQGFKRVAIVDPGVKVDSPGLYDIYDTAHQQGFFIKNGDGSDYVGAVWPGGTSFPDFSRQPVRHWWGMLHNRYISAGINGFWNDMNEPADHASGSGTTPDHLRMEDEGEWSTMHRMHNQYALLMAQATVDEGLEQLRPHDRPFLLTRAASPGMQRYAALWGGDNCSSWTHLKASIAQLINMGLSGVGFFGVDVGGFSGNCQPELLARWTQLGAFYPFFRNHCAINQNSQEPWSFGPRIEAICRDAIALRYHLLPYFYQLFHQMHTSGAPMARPLFWHYQSDGCTHALNDSFLMGRYLLVAPITERGSTSRMVYFPTGGWIDYYTGEKVSGPAHRLIEVPLERIGLFVREGTLLPVLDPLDSTAAVDRTQLILKLFEGEQDFDEQFYEDDTCTTAYRQGNFCFNRLRYQKGRVVVELDSASAITTVSLMRRDAAGVWQRYQRQGAAHIEFVLPSR